MDMLYYIYIGSNRVHHRPLEQNYGRHVHGCFILQQSGERSSTVSANGTTHPFFTSRKHPSKGQPEHQLSCTSASPVSTSSSSLRRTADRNSRKLYLQAGVNNTLSPMASEESLQQMTKFLQLRKEHKLQEFSQSHRKIFNTFHLPMWKRIFDILFAVCRTDCAVSAYSSRQP